MDTQAGTHTAAVVRIAVVEAHTADKPVSEVVCTVAVYTAARLADMAAADTTEAVAAQFVSAYKTAAQMQSVQSAQSACL